ncbi:MAG: 3-hydroxybutyryl-CoA dehydrogenase [Pseudomonadota bacterium]
MEIKKIGVLGCGLMGAGIVETAARAGFDVVVREINDELLEGGIARIRKNLGRAVKKGNMAQYAMDAILDRIQGTTELEPLAQADLVIEAVVENLELKQGLWKELDRLCSAHTIFASNTSSLKIGIQAVVTERKEHFVGLHFFNPVPVMKLVEVVRTEDTSDATHATVMDFARALGKDPITCIDTTGFVVNRLLIPYLLDAIRALEKGIASREDIDKGMILGCGHPMGPLTLLDFVGLDTTLFIAGIMYDEFGEPQYKAPELLKTMVGEGRFGRKSGQGFFTY